MKRRTRQDMSCQRLVGAPSAISGMRQLSSKLASLNGALHSKGNRCCQGRHLIGMHFGGKKERGADL